MDDGWKSVAAAAAITTFTESPGPVRPKIEFQDQKKLNLLFYLFDERLKFRNKRN